jgi:hypothetical protein
MDEGFQSRMGFNGYEGGERGLAGWEPVSYWKTTASMLYSVLSIAEWYENDELAPPVAISDVAGWPPRILPVDPVEQAELLTGERREVPSYLPPSLLVDLHARGGLVWPSMIRPKPDWDWTTTQRLYLERYRGALAEPEPEYGATIRPLASWSTSVGTGRLLLDRYVNGLLRLGQPHLVYRGAQRRSALLATNGLFGALALQLLLRLHGSVGFVICSGCNMFFAPLRRPALQSPAYCPQCRRTKANAERQRRWRSRQSA